ncbi:MAG TPA: uracil-DNA glycosylase [Dongiaceae bacterium]|nr:uracil-DNA glycosylase [Dongiaceae bacterium]
MSDTDAVRDGVRARLEWLRLLGVDAVRRRAATPAGNSALDAGISPGTPAPAPAGASAPFPEPAPAPAGQSRLFSAGDPEPPPAVRAPRGRERAAASESASPLVDALQAAPVQDATTGLQALRDELGDCTRCRLSEKRTNVVFGVGSPGARLMFVGEGPGADEDAQGEPFVGRAGQLLTKIIEAMGLTRRDVYIANIVKCRPPENRVPLPDEVATCSPFLMRQIGIIRPRVIVCLGTPSAQTLLGTRETITRLRGAFREIAGIRVMPTFHPAYLLRNPAAKREVWEDMKQVMAVLAADA